MRVAYLLAAAAIISGVVHQWRTVKRVKANTLQRLAQEQQTLRRLPFA